MVFITSLEPIYSFFHVQIALFKLDEAFSAILLEYTDFADIFSLDLIMELLEYIQINNYAIKLVDSKQLSINRFIAKNQ